MKRKLISYDVFKQLEARSLTQLKNELVEAEDVLATTLGVEGVELFTFSESDVTYKTADGNYIHATFTMDDNKVILEDIKELVIEQESERQSARKTISDMIDSLLENDGKTAESLFESYIHMPFVRRELAVNEGVRLMEGKSPLKGHKQSPAVIAKRTRARNEAIAKLTPAERKNLGRHKKGQFYAKVIAPKTMKEWTRMCENVLGYLNYINNGSVLSETAVKADDHGNVTAVSMPTSKAKKSGKALTMDFKTMDTELKVLRGSMKHMAEDQTFIKAMADLKRYNNISDNSALEESLEAIVSHWPDILFVTEGELAQYINEALTTAGVSNFDDETCAFMAEAILRTAHNAYSDRVRRIANIAGSEKDVTSECQDCEDAYREFSEISSYLYRQLDESLENEVRIFADLYSALHEVYQIAASHGDEATRIEVSDLMRECYAIVNNAALPDLALAESIANYLADLLESEEHSESGWDHKVEINPSGDHSMTKWNAKQAAVASNNQGGWKDAAPVSDGKSYHGHSDEMGHNSLANHGKDSWPDLHNPMHPKSVFPKMKEKSVVDDSGLGSMSTGDTWPNLKNPMSLKPVMPKPVV